jgi:ubiquinone/menaquinone biosynthesis C-methylase UbiE
MKMAKIKPFEEYTVRYEDWFERNKFGYRSELQAVRIQLPEKGEGAEIGVGTGRFAAPLGIKHGVEPSAKMREIAKQRGIDVMDGTAEKLPFDDSRFDYLLMVTTICFLDDVLGSLKEAYRVI